MAGRHAARFRRIRMNAYSRWAALALLGTGLAIGGAASHAAEDGGHTDSHSEGHTSGGKGKGPKYMGGGDRGSSHSSVSHKGGSSHHDGSKGGSKSTESKVFHSEPGGHDTSHEDGSTEHSH
jgi:hypothetical protein